MNSCLKGLEKAGRTGASLGLAPEDIRKRGEGGNFLPKREVLKKTPD